MDNQPTNQLNAVRHFDIDAQELPAALLQFGEQAELTVMVHHHASGNTPGLQGEYTTDEALQQLLAGTGLEYRIKGEAIIVTRLQLVAELTSDPRTKKAPLLKRLGTAIAAAIFATSGAAAIAADDATADSNEAVIEEVVVTATKRDTSLQDTAIAITAYTTEDLYRQGIENFEDFSRQTPGVNLTGTKHYQKFVIRGIESSARQSGIGEQNPVAVYYDEVPVTFSNVATPDIRLYDVERVEVLRGPQGTSFGAGTLAGAVRVITKKANLEGFESSVRVEGASTDGGGIRQRYSGMVNIPVSDSAALRLVGYVRDEEGWVDNLGKFGQPFREDFNDSEDWGVRASLRWEPNDRSVLTFSIMHDDVTSATAANDFLNPAHGDYASAQHTTGKGVLIKNDQFNLTFEYDFTWAQLVSSTTWATPEVNGDVDLDNIFTDFMPFQLNEVQDHDAFVQELRLVSSHGGNVEWLAGLFYLNRSIDHLGDPYTTKSFLDAQGIDYSGLPNPLGGGRDRIQALLIGRDIEENEAAIFAELTYRFTETLSLTAGVRYTEFEFYDQLTPKGGTTNLFDLIFGGSGGVATYTPDTLARADTGKQSKTTTKFSINWQPNDSQTFYITAAQGFRRPHPNATALQPCLFTDPDAAEAYAIAEQSGQTAVIPLVADSDELWNYELGAKTRLLAGRLMANVAAYRLDWTRHQVNLTRACDAFQFVGNSGDVESTGIEAELFYMPTANLELGLNLTLASSEIVSLTQAEAIASGMVLGSPMAAPERQVSGFAQYTYPLGSGGAIYARVDVQHVGEYPNAPPNTPGSPTQDPNTNFQFTDAYENVNLQVGWETDKYTLTLFGENVFNNDDIVTVNPDFYTLNRFRKLRPRTIGLRADWYFAR